MTGQQRAGSTLRRAAEPEAPLQTTWQGLGQGSSSTARVLTASSSSGSLGSGGADAATTGRNSASGQASALSVPALPPLPPAPPPGFESEAEEAAYWRAAGPALAQAASMLRYDVSGVRDVGSMCVCVDVMAAGPCIRDVEPFTTSSQRPRNRPQTQLVYAFMLSVEKLVVIDAWKYTYVRSHHGNVTTPHQPPSIHKCFAVAFRLMCAFFACLLQTLACHCLCMPG